MEKKAPDSAKNSISVELADLKQLAADWMLDGEIQLLSPKTIDERRDTVSKLFWFCEREGYTHVGVRELKAFLHHLAIGHTEPKGRFGNPRLNKPLRPVSLRGWYIVLAAWFHWCHEEGYLEAHLMSGIKKPRAQTETKPPLSSQQVAKMLRAAKEGLYPQRDTAILLLMVDTGLRASELISLRVSDVDLTNRSLVVLGKGNKKRASFLGRQSTKALSVYLRTTRRDGERLQGDDYLFFAEAGVNVGDPMKIHGLQQLINRLAKRAGIEGSCSPHALRRTFAMSFLQAGGNVFALQALMGHSDLTMTRRYCKVVEADCAEQHRKFSPADRLKTW